MGKIGGPFRGLVLGAFSWWLALVVATAFWLPGASYLFVWPTLCGLLGLSISIRLAPGSLMAWVAARLLARFPLFLLVAPLIRATFDGLSLGMTAPIMILVVLFTEDLMPLWGPLLLQKPERERRARNDQTRRPLQLQVEHAS